MGSQKTPKPEKLKMWAEFYTHYADWIHKYANCMREMTGVLIHLADVQERTKDERNC